MKPDASAAEDGSDFKTLLQLTAEITMGFASNNPLPVAEVPALMRSVHNTLRGISGRDGAAPNEPLKPAVPVRKSVSPDHIVCLEDGKKLKMLKRYLRSRYQLTPDQYRAKWVLPADYPMVAPNYAAQRSAFAKKIGLGRKNPQRQRRRTGRPS
ncbi:MAG: MucR family transcriptional regulator [Rhizomicrobium sp.]